jgi:DNA-binding transcriptional MerR regulator
MELSCVPYLFLAEVDETKMKISELSKRTNVPKETIHYYVREGFIPRPKKKGKNVSDYDETFIERILLIKQIQDHFFLPLSVIKKIIKQQNKSPELKALLELRMGYFSPLDQFLQKEVVGEEAFCRATSMGKKWLARFEDWGVISSFPREGEKVYSQDEVIIGRLLVDLDRAGFGPKDGFDPGIARRYMDLFRQIVQLAHENFLNTNLDKFTPEENLERGIRGRELMGVFFYHLYRKLVRKEDGRRRGPV